jgi:hypothetical protein
MTGRAVDAGIRLLTAVTVLLLMTVAPISLTDASHAPPEGNRPERVLAILEIKNNGKYALSACPSMSEADSLRSIFENGLDADVEDELILSSPPTVVPFGVLHSPCLAVYGELIGCAVPLAARPLRC